jgi:isoquinoline 1-oxidoreductase alpha subunit
MAIYTLTVNGVERTVEAEPEMPLLWVLRDLLGLTGTKYGCGIGRCGSCTVHIDGAAVQSCRRTISRAAGTSVTTIEGLSESGDHPLQIIWDELDVSQCGFCQPGQIMHAAAWLEENPEPTPEDIDRLQSRILCRCGTYTRIREALRQVANVAEE